MSASENHGESSKSLIEINDRSLPSLSIIYPEMGIKYRQPARKRLQPHLDILRTMQEHETADPERIRHEHAKVLLAGCSGVLGAIVEETVLPSFAT